jgi:large subunit ribosomal protein L18
MTIKSPAERYKFRKIRTRRNVFGTPDRPLSVHRSSKHIYAQVVDDVNGRTLASASSVDPDLRSDLKSGGNQDAARAVGKLVAERAKNAKVELVVFDRGGWSYHGRIKALAEGAREAGLKF